MREIKLSIPIIVSIRPYSSSENIKANTGKSNTLLTIVDITEADSRSVKSLVYLFIYIFFNISTISLCIKKSIQLRKLFIYNTRFKIQSLNTFVISVHILIIFLIFSRSNIIHPSLIIKIPSHSLLYAFFKLQTRFPSQFFL